MTLTFKFDLLFKNFNLGYNLWTVKGSAFIFHMCIPCDKSFQFIPWFLASWDKYVRGANVIALPSASVACTKTLTLAITSKKEVIDLSYCICVFPVTRPFTWYHNFWPWSLTYFWKTLTLAITFKPEVISSPTYKNVVTQKVQLFRRAKKHIFKGALSNEFVQFQNVVSPGFEP